MRIMWERHLRTLYPNSENHMEKKMEEEMETGVIEICVYIYILNPKP